MPTHILTVDDDAHIRDVIRFAVEGAGMRVTEADSGLKAVSNIATVKPDLVVLDIGMPDMDGFETCKIIRRSSNVPVLFLTARDEEIDRVLGFQLGADDYVTKPFSPRELVLRIKAILARGQSNSVVEPALTHQHLRIDPGAHVCTLGEADLSLTAIEFATLAALARAPERVLSRSQLIEAVYGTNTHLSGRTVDSHIRNIRQKAQALGYRDVIRTVHGVGVKLGGCQG